MEIVAAKLDDYELIQNFLLPWEKFCVNLCANIRKKKEKIYIIKNDDLICGVFYLDKTMLYFIPESKYLSQIEQTLADFLKDKHISCLSGEAQSAQVILKAFSKNNQIPYQTNHYNLMVLEEEPLSPPEELSCDDEIRRCTTADTDIQLLLPLQKMYMAKEVAPPGKQVTDLEASAQVKSILKDQLCFTLQSDDEIVAKANTNAIGFKYVQLGGIYTHPLYRKNYYAWHLIYTICQRILKTQRKPVLFVKEKNNPAVALYNRIGFEQTGKYQISYF